MTHDGDKRLDDVLNECIDRLGRGASIEDCLADHADVAEELRPLLLTAHVLQSAARLRARAEARTAGRARLEQVMAAQRAKRRWQPALPGPIMAWAASAAMLVMVLGGFGVVSASSGSVPGDALYPVKRTVERVQLAWPLQSDEAKARRSERLASKRAEELVKVLERGDTVKAEQVSLRITHNLERATRIRSKAEEKVAEEHVALAQQEATLEPREPTVAPPNTVESPADPTSEPPTTSESENPTSDTPESVEPTQDRVRTAPPAVTVPQVEATSPPSQEPERPNERLSQARETFLTLAAERASTLEDAKHRLEAEAEKQTERIRTAAAKAGPIARRRAEALVERIEGDYQTAIEEIDENLKAIAAARHDVERRVRRDPAHQASDPTAAEPTNHPAESDTGGREPGRDRRGESERPPPAGDGSHDQGSDNTSGDQEPRPPRRERPADRTGDQDDPQRPVRGQPVSGEDGSQDGGAVEETDREAQQRRHEEEAREEEAQQRQREEAQRRREAQRD